MVGKSKVLKFIYRYGILCVGLFIYAIAFNMFMVPYDFVIGGVTGTSIIVENFFHINESLTVTVLSVLLLIIGFVLVDKDRMYSSVASTFVLPFFIEITSNITEGLNINFSPLLAALYCAILSGVAMGLVFKVGFSTGGTDIIYWIVQKYVKKSSGQLMLMVEGIIVGAGFFVFGFEKLMYSLIVLFLTSKLTDKIVIGISDSKVLWIISKKYEEVWEYLNSLSFVKSVSLKTKDSKDVIYCVVLTKDYKVIYDHIKLIDGNAFLSVSNTYETKGGLKYE